MNQRSTHELRKKGFRPQPGVLIGIALILLAIIIAAIAFAYQTSTRALLLAQQRTLSTLTELQADAMTSRMRQRVMIGQAITENSAFRSKLVEFEDTRSSTALAQINEQLSQYKGLFDIYDLQLYDPSGRSIASTAQATVPPPDIQKSVTRALEIGRPIFTPIWRASDKLFIASLVMPINIRRDDRAPVRAALLINSTLTKTLYAGLASTIRNDASADIFLMRREADKSWLISSPQRDASLPPLTVHVPASTYDFAVPTGDVLHEPIIGIDHNGNTVLAVKQSISIPTAESVPIALVAKVDRDAVLADTRLMTALALTMALLVFLLAFAVGYAINQRNKRRISQRLLIQANALSLAEARFRATFEQAAVGLAHITLDNRLLRCNERLSTMLGYDKKEMEGALCLRFLAPDSNERVIAMRRDLEAGHLPFLTAEEHYIRKDGSSIWLDCTTSVARDAEGKPDYFIQVYQDISARRAQEKELRESQQRFELAIRGTEEGVWDWDRKSSGLFLSSRARELLGLDGTKPVDVRQLWTLLIHPEDRSSFRTAWFNFRKGKASLFECELRLRKSDGEYHEYWIRGFGNRDEAGELQRIVGLLADVSQRKQTVRRLNLAAAVFANSREGIVVTDLSGRVSAINPSFTRVTGYEEKDIIGQNMRTLHSGRHERNFYIKLWNSVLKTGYWDGEIWNRRKDGVIFLEHLSISTVYDAKGLPINYVGAFHDITQIKRSEQALDHMAHFDPLTDLPNRTLLTSLVDHAANRPEAHCAVLCVDLDRFKTINESFGHLVGDQVLRISAERMQSILKGNATLGRYGADEFVVLLEDLKDMQQACDVASQIICALGAPYMLTGGIEAYVGASVGISLFPEDASNAQDLMQHANSALSEAKANGRGTFSLYTKSLTQDAKTRVELESDLRRALVRKEFVLHFQPFLELANGRVRGVEALVRWQSPTQGLVMHGHFIPLAEETGLIVPLGDWVMEESCRQMAKWLREGKICDYIAVNLSPRQFNRDNLCNWVEQVLKDSGLPPERLEIEITESVLFDTRAEAEKKCERLHAMGVRLALDDFGTGYSSLGYLKRFPITKLKIDRSFVNDLPRSVADSEIADAIISVARALGLEVVAEGIETTAQYNFLNAHGCDLGQGFLFSKPLPVDQLEALIKDGQINISGEQDT